MRSFFKRSELIVLTAIIGFSMIACDHGDTNRGNTYFGEELALTGEPVYIGIRNYDESRLPSIRWETYTDDATINEDYLFGGKGEIKDEKFAYTLEIPAAAYLISIEDFLVSKGANSMYKNIAVSDSEVQVLGISGFMTTDWSYLHREEESSEKSGNKESGRGTVINVQVVYVYVDADVKITGTGLSRTDPRRNRYGYKNLNLSLEKGWNVVRITDNVQYEWSEETSQLIDTISVSLGDADTRWIIDWKDDTNWGDDDYSDDDYRNRSLAPTVREPLYKKLNWQFLW